MTMLISKKNFEPFPKAWLRSSRYTLEVMLVMTDSAYSHHYIEESATQTIRHSRKVQFIHESVRDFLLQHNGHGLRLIDPRIDQFAVGKSHDYLTKVCVSYLSTEELQIDQVPNIYDNFADRQAAASDVAKLYTEYVFWDYAVRSLFEHATKAE